MSARNPVSMPDWLAVMADRLAESEKFFSQTFVCDCEDCAKDGGALLVIFNMPGTASRNEARREAMRTPKYIIDAARERGLVPWVGTQFANAYFAFNANDPGWRNTVSQ